MPPLSLQHLKHVNDSLEQNIWSHVGNSSGRKSCSMCTRGTVVITYVLSELQSAVNTPAGKIH